MNTKRTAGVCDEQIDIDKIYEIWDWADKFKVSAERLRSAVLAAGRSVSAVRSYLKK